MAPIDATPSHIITPDSLTPTSPYTDQKVGWWAGVPVATDPITDTDKHGPNHSITPSKRSRPLGEADPTVTNHHQKYIHIYIYGTTITGPGTGERIYIQWHEQNRADMYQKGCLIFKFPHYSYVYRNIVGIIITCIKSFIFEGNMHCLCTISIFEIQHLGLLVKLFQSLPT